MLTRALPVAFTLLVPTAALAQSPTAATYITDEEVKAVNALPGQIDESPPPTSAS